MRILYAFQGTGNGHHARAQEFVPILKTLGEVDVWVSGGATNKKYEVSVDRQLRGVGFSFGTKGGISIGETLRQQRPVQALRDITNGGLTPYDLVFNDFEPISAWAARWQGVPVVGVSHQIAVHHPASPKPTKVDSLGMGVLKHYAPCSHPLGFHFQRYAPDIHTPVIRSSVREVPVSDEGHVVVYLPAYSEARIVKVLDQMPKQSWWVFSNRCAKPYTHRNIHVEPTSSQGFLRCMASAKGVLCGAGFETPSEALHLGKSLMVVPMHGQFEQQCNAAALAQMGVPVLPFFDDSRVPDLREWVNQGPCVEVDYPDDSRDILTRAAEICLGSTR